MPERKVLDTLVTRASPDPGATPRVVLALVADKQEDGSATSARRSKRRGGPREAGH
jgi:hypothetical protein